MKHFKNNAYKLVKRFTRTVMKTNIYNIILLKYCIISNYVVVVFVHDTNLVKSGYNVQLHEDLRQLRRQRLVITIENDCFF